MLGRREGIPVVEGGKRNAGGRSIAPPGEQPCPATRAEHAVELLRRRIAARLAFDRDRRLCEQGAGKIRRTHRLLAQPAMADADIDRLAHAAEANRPAQTSAYPCHVVSMGE